MPRPAEPAWPIVVIGVGNALRGDDAAGIAVVRRMRRRPGIRVVEQSGEATALMEALCDASAALVVDAAVGTQPGRWQRLDAAAQTLPQAFFGGSTHGFGVAEGIELTRALGTLPRACVVYVIEGSWFAIGATMSPAVQHAISTVAIRLEGEVRALRHLQVEGGVGRKEATSANHGRPNDSRE